MKIDSFDFELPQNLIAQNKNETNESRMLVVSNNQLNDASFQDFFSYINSKDLIIFNDSKVIKAKLKAFSGNKCLELNLIEKLENNFWNALAKKTSRFAKGEILKISQDFSFKIIDIDKGLVKLQFLQDNYLDFIDQYGETPLPPYIKRTNGINNKDNENYQTIYAKNKGSLAAPTAGLHFKKSDLEKLKQKNINYDFITLHVGAGTFLPVKTNDITQHHMHTELFHIKKSTLEKIKQTKNNGGKIIAIGTTSLRVLETISDQLDNSTDINSKTNIFIYPGYKFKLVDKILTNFHLPKSTLFMLVCAFSGTSTMQNAYKHAVKNKYKFFSYGDCTFLERNND